MDPVTLVVVSGTYAASMVLHKCADKFLDSAYDKIWDFLKAKLGREPDPKTIRQDVTNSLQSESEAIVGQAEEVFAQSPVLRRAQLVSSVLNGAKVLWIDDNPDWVAYECELFGAFGIKTTVTTSLEDAMTSIRTDLPDLIISDIARGHQPEAGLESLRALKAKYPSIPVIFYVGYADKDRGIPAQAWSICDSPAELFHSAMDVIERRLA